MVLFSENVTVIYLSSYDLHEIENTVDLYERLQSSRVWLFSNFSQGFNGIRK